MLCSLRFNLKNLKPTNLRSFSAVKEKFIDVDINDKTGTAILNLNRPPVNALNLEFLENLNDTIKNVEGNKCRGLILTSNISRIFSSGLDFKELYKPNKERFKQFNAAIQDTWLTLYSCRLPTAALINGNSPAGGCVYASCCDYRVMLPNFNVGLNETQVGLAVPGYIMSSFCNILPKRQAELALTQGKMFTTEEAFNVGLVDEIVADKEEGLKKCEQFINTFNGVNSEARAFTKLLFRQKDIEEFHVNRTKDLDKFVSIIMSTEFQEQLEKYMEGLKNKNA